MNSSVVYLLIGALLLCFPDFTVAIGGAYLAIIAWRLLPK
jgi:hypothetical protein